MNPDRFESFALAYSPAIMQAARSCGVFLASGESLEDYALRTTIDILDMIQAKGVESVQHYFLNTHGGAFRLTCSVLGIENTVKAMQNYLDGVWNDRQSNAG